VKRLWIVSVVLALIASGCSRKSAPSSASSPAAFGSAIVESSGGKQVAAVGTTLPQPVVVQVNDDHGNAVAGARVELSGPAGVAFDPASGVTDSSGQFMANVSLGGMAGRYQITASTVDKSQKQIDLKLEETALGYQQMLGQQLNGRYCERCHNPESTPERVSNYDNLEVQPHTFTEGDFLNKLSDQDLTAIISHGGPALNQPALMPPYGYTLSKSDVQSLIAYIRAISDPPFHGPGLAYEKK
jgi:mono/diheme cytochrome c family protein